MIVITKYSLRSWFWCVFLVIFDFYYTNIPYQNDCLRKGHPLQCLKGGNPSITEQCLDRVWVGYRKGIPWVSLGYSFSISVL